MANINSLTYLLYSILSLTANNKPTTDPTLNAGEIGSDSQITVAWDQEPDHVTRKFQPSAEQYPYNPSRAFADILNSGGCPIFSECDKNCKRQGHKSGRCTGPGSLICHCNKNPVSNIARDILNSGGCPSMIECSRQCKRKGYKYGICSGPGNKNCACYRHWGAEVDPDETVSAEKVTEIPDMPHDILNSDGCPSMNVCSRQCKRQGHKYGICSGPGSRYCVCYRNLGAEVDPDETVSAEKVTEISDIPHVDPDETVSAEKVTEISDIPHGILNTGGCPSNNACTEYCKNHYGKKVGNCSGFQRMECLCFDHW